MVDTRRPWVLHALRTASDVCTIRAVTSTAYLQDRHVNFSEFSQFWLRFCQPSQYINQKGSEISFVDANDHLLLKTQLMECLRSWSLIAVITTTLVLGTGLWRLWVTKTNPCVSVSEFIMSLNFDWRMMCSGWPWFSWWPSTIFIFLEPFHASPIVANVIYLSLHHREIIAGSKERWQEVTVIWR